MTIAIPVYNIEKYLRPCLESCMKQTLRNVQILCVDHGSTDGSRAILEEFAAGDSRVEIVDCPNTGGGPGQARNAAFAHIRGRYTYFADSDDWLDAALCEKTCRHLDATGADVVWIDHYDVTPSGKILLARRGGKKPRASGADAMAYVNNRVTPWSRVIRTAFVDEHQLRFCEGNLSEDVYFHWIMLAHNPRVESIGEKLYYYRKLKTSISGRHGEYMARLPEVFVRIRDYFEMRGLFEKNKKVWLEKKLEAVQVSFFSVTKAFRPLAKQVAVASFRDDEWGMLDDANLVARRKTRLIRDLKNGKNCMGRLFLKWLDSHVTKPIEHGAKNLMRLIGKD